MSRWKIELIGLVVTVLSTAVGVYQLASDPLRESGRRALAEEIAEELRQQGVGAPDAAERVARGQIGQVIADAVAEVREVRNTFDLTEGQSVELTEHGILMSRTGIGTNPREARVHVAGRRVDLALGTGYRLPAPAENCIVQLVRQYDWEAVRKRTILARANFRLKCT